jgi:Spy/CpxP family protein refolding chaperone
MKRTIGIAFLAALGAVPATAQPPGQGPPEGRRGQRGEALFEYLGLSPEQQEQWRALHEQHREAMKPFREEGRALHQQVQKSLEAGEAEVLVGGAVRALYDHRQEMKAAREAFQGQLESVLTAEQKEKFEAFKAARGLRGKGRGGRGRGRGARGPCGGGAGGGWGGPPSEG